MAMPRVKTCNMDNSLHLTLNSMVTNKQEAPSGGGSIEARLIDTPSSWRGNKKNPWPESASELYRPSDRRLSPKLLPNFADRGCHVVSVTDPYGRILGFLD
jgi:hypothetical protein